tara:strand:+ start:4430 stop:4636 length:207 start_codon:yes stop_codon:yes gene_type:complete
MTEHDLNTGKSIANVYDTDVAISTNGVTDQWDVVNVRADIVSTQWDAALASADDALVLIQWLESKRTS